MKRGERYLVYGRMKERERGRKWKQMLFDDSF